VIDELEREMVERIFEFRDLDAREVMVPRTELTCVDENATVAAALEQARASRHSRLPVHTGDLDEIWGIFDVRDLPAWRGRGIERQTIREVVEQTDAMADPPKRPLVRPAFLVPETRHVGDLMREMRHSGEHMAILLDEYGGTAGLVTLQQFVDELVGGVLARGRDGEPLSREVDGRLQILGEARLRDVCHELGLELPLGETDTIGGYVMGLFGRLPRRGETVGDGRYSFRVLHMVGRRVGAVEVQPLERPGGEHGGGAP
jgi:CBS domain containing-hemolysin-like protein